MLPIVKQAYAAIVLFNFVCIIGKYATWGSVFGETCGIVSAVLCVPVVGGFVLEMGYYLYCHRRR